MWRLGWIGLLLVAPFFVTAFETPVSTTYFVNDFAKVLSPEFNAQLNEDLRKFNASTTNQIVVAIVPDMGGDYIENYSIKLATKWKIGTKENDNGALLLLAIAERESRIEVGYGLEGALPDSVADSILRGMTENLRAGNYDAAIGGAVENMKKATRNEYTGDEATGSKNNIPFDFIFFAFIFGIQWIAAILGRTKEWWLGGVLGAIAGAGISFFFVSSLILSGVLTFGLLILGLVIDYFVSRGYHSYQDNGSTPPWYFGGPSQGGGSFGGGFSGGGGGFGGGGASGRW